MDNYAVFGNPIAHSKSPDIHHTFAKQTDQLINYRALLAPVKEFNSAVSSFFVQGGLGANVTLPFKEQAFEFADQLTDRAESAGAVNTLVKQPDGSILGDNTDGAGLVFDLRRQLGELKGKRVLLLGAGGAAKGVLLPLLQQDCSQIVIANRTISKAQQLASRFDADIHATGFQDIPDLKYHIVINSTSSSVNGDALPVADHCFTAAELAYDMFYASEPTPFMQKARSLNPNCIVSDGLGMLVGQAAESFYLWRNVFPDIETVLTALRAKL